MSLTRRYSDSNPSGCPAAPTVFVVDSDSSIHKALDVVIRSAGWQPRMAASAEGFLARPRVITPSCLVAELNLPGPTGLDLQTMSRDRRELPIIFMSDCVDVHCNVQAMKGEAFELLTKPLGTDVVLSAIRNAIALSRGVLDYLAHIHTLQARYESLSAREREVMSLLVSGRLNKQVSGDLGITEFTVRVHRARMMQKMRASSFAELAANTGIPPDRDFVRLSNQGLDRRRLTRVTEYITANLERDLTIAQLAKVAFLSRFHFARAFKAAMGQSPHQYVSVQRLERAKELLVRGAESLLEIAIALNFSSQANFTRAFRQGTGMTPGQYRRCFMHSENLPGTTARRSAAAALASGRCWAAA